VIEDLREKKNTTLDSKLNVSLETHIAKEKELDMQLSQQEK
jgi:hypothetical protein